MASMPSDVAIPLAVSVLENRNPCGVATCMETTAYRRGTCFVLETSVCAAKPFTRPVGCPPANCGWINFT